ncbi:hypothetical protein [Saccharopolyspora sp. CA-218241]
MPRTTFTTGADKPRMVQPTGLRRASSPVHRHHDQLGAGTVDGAPLRKS